MNLQPNIPRTSNPEILTTTAPGTATTTTTSAASITATTTATTSTSNSSAYTPAITTKIANRAVGSHAQEFKLDWKKQTDQAKYLQITGLSEAHAAILNDDWETAEKMLHSVSVSEIWNYNAADNPGWLEDLQSPN